MRASLTAAGSVRQSCHRPRTGVPRTRTPWALRATRDRLESPQAEGPERGFLRVSAFRGDHRKAGSYTRATRGLDQGGAMFRHAVQRASRIRSIAVGGVAAAALVVLPGCEQIAGDSPGVSGTCTQPTLLNNAFVANRSVQFDVRVQQDPADERKLWICFRGKAGTAAEGGRISLRPPTATAVTPTTDNESRACELEPGNLITGRHPIDSGSVGGTPYYLDAYGSTQAVWICLEAGGVKQRVIVPAPYTSSHAAALTDPSPPAMQPTALPQPGRNSSSCYEGDYGPSTELVNSHQGNQQVFLYTAQPSATEMHICARLDGTAQGGVDLGVNAAVGEIVRLDQSPDVSRCTVEVITHNDPPMSLKVTPVGQFPPAVCLNGIKYTVVTGSAPPDLVDPQFDD